jgi:endonuclease YncB( thermonuclease family)
MWTEPFSCPCIVLQVVLVNLMAHVVLSAIRQRFYPDTRKNLEAAEYDYRRYLARVSEFRRRLSLELCEDSDVLFRRPGDLKRDMPAQMRRLWSNLFSPTFFFGATVCGVMVGVFANTSQISYLAIGLAMIAALQVIFNRRTSFALDRSQSDLPPFQANAVTQSGRKINLAKASDCVSQEPSQCLMPKVVRWVDSHRHGDSLEGVKKGPGKRQTAFEPREANAQATRSGCNALGTLFLELTSLYDLEHRLGYSQKKLGLAGQFQAGYFLGLFVFTLWILIGFEQEPVMELLQLPSLWSVLILVSVLGWFWLMKIPRFERLQDLVS